MNIDVPQTSHALAARAVTQLQHFRRWVSHSQARRSAALVVAVLAAGTLGSVLIVASAAAPPPAPLFEKAWPVSVLTARPSQLSPQLTAYGRVESASVARLRTAIDAPVASTLVREGDTVAKGQLLIQLEPRTFELTLIERQAELVRAESALHSTRNDAATATRNLAHHRVLAGIAQDKLRRFEALFARGMVPVTLLDEVRDAASQRDISLGEQETAKRNYPNTLTEQAAEVTRARALRDRARLDLLETQVRAPFAGPVLALHVAPGDRSTVPVLIEVADSAALEVRAAIADRHIGALRRALDAALPVLADAQIEGRTVRLQLRRIGQGVRAGQASVDGFFGFAATAADTAAAAGMHPAIGSVLDLRISLPPGPGLLALPVTALYDNQRIYGVQQSRLVAFDIERVGDQLGPKGEPLVVVRALNLPTGAEIVTTHLPRAISGLLVHPIQAAGQVATPASRPDARAAIPAATSRQVVDADSRAAATATPSAPAPPAPAPRPSASAMGRPAAGP